MLCLEAIYLITISPAGESIEVVDEEDDVVDQHRFVMVTEPYGAAERTGGIRSPRFGLGALHTILRWCGYRC
jgi:hypothetical protein